MAHLVRYRDASVECSAQQGELRLEFILENRGSQAWRGQEGFAMGWQVFDPSTAIFITEGEWTTLEGEVEPGASTRARVTITLPPQDGCYRVYVSALHPRQGWLYTHGEPLLLVDAEVRGGVISRHAVSSSTLRRMRRANLVPSLRRMLTQPFEDVWIHRRLIGSLTRREILARYRGSFGDAAWTILHPLLLMATYFFVFGIVLESRFGNDPSRAGFALYFLAGMLPWLAFSEPVGRAPYVIFEYRNFVKKLVFPVTILPVNQVIAGLVTSLFATVLYLAALLLIRGTLPWTAALLPLLLVPQVLFTLGLCWFLAALGVFLRDLAQVMTFLLTLWFFLTPICYPETSLPKALVPLLAKNPMFQIVRGYREIFLDGSVPSWTMLVKLWLLAIVVFLAGHAWFTRLRRTFADVV
ncbi:MAG: ABC transporter permease [Bryobacterales bacterium]|nr:ABC transporter permease [Bryobacterales bacterium]